MSHNAINTPLEILAPAVVESNLIEGITGAEAFENSMDAWAYLSRLKTLPSLDTIETVHWLITRNQLEPEEAGNMRSKLLPVDVAIAGRRGTPWTQVRHEMMNWLMDLAIKSPKESHVQFEKIHPFVDGNGRTGRLIYYWQLAHLGQFDTDSIIFNKDKASYYGWF